MTSFRTIALAAAFLASGSQHASAQATDYPNRSVTFVVPFAPGGVTRIVRAAARAEAGADVSAKPFVVENRPGGGGVTAATAVARAAPDGYTIMMASIDGARDQREQCARTLPTIRARI